MLINHEHQLFALLKSTTLHCEITIFLKVLPIYPKTKLFCEIA